MMLTSATKRTRGRPFPKGHKLSGSRKGIPNKITTEVRTLAQNLIDRPEYRARLAERLLEGTAGPMEPLLWHYGYGKPQDVITIHQSLPILVIRRRDDDPDDA